MNFCQEVYRGVVSKKCELPIHLSGTKVPLFEFIFVPRPKGRGYYVMPSFFSGDNIIQTPNSPAQGGLFSLVPLAVFQPCKED